MKKTFVLASTSLLVAVLVSQVTQASPSAPSASSLPSVGRPALKAVTAITTSNVIGAVGDRVMFVATLTANGAPVVGKKVTFGIVDSTQFGSATTDATGTATLVYEVPEVGQKGSPYQASFAGDDTALGSKTNGLFSTLKGVTKLELGDMSWGTYKDEGGIAHGTISVKLTAGSAGHSLGKPVKITVNGQSWTLPPSGFALVPLMPPDTTWKVTAVFDGTDSYLPSTASRTYHKP